jgi:hypothetical protein
MSSAFSSYAASPASLTDAYGTQQPPAVAPASTSVSGDAERTDKLKELKARIHNSVSKVSSKMSMGEFSPPTHATVASKSLEDPPVYPGESFPEQSIAGFTSDYSTNAYGTGYAKPEEQKHLLEKLNYAIHLLETQHDRRTATVTEELLLYGLLGMFIICVLDNFARVGKYVR